MPVDMKVISPQRAASVQTQLIQEREKFCQEAEFAAKLIQAWGIVGKDIGETSSGHQRFAPLDPDEIVGRAVLTTELAFDAFRAHGWLINLPSIDELLAGEDRKTGFVHASPSDDIPF